MRIDRVRHVVTCAPGNAAHQVQVKKRGDDKRCMAKVLVASRDCDIALLTVETDEFWEDIKQVRLGELPALQDEVRAAASQH